MKDCIEAIENRRSIRKFKEKQVSKSDINILLHSAQMAPSAGNLQAREFIVVSSEGGREKLARAALKQEFLREAPITIVVCANLKRSEMRYRSRSALYAIQDATASVMNILLAAYSLGLGTCWVGAFDEREVSSLLSLPEHVRPIALVLVGYPDEAPMAPPRLDEKIEHWEKWVIQSVDD
ncbi:MAG: nitroreductase family protein [Methanocellales archaeon]|nr:nitroreductase family protein [Methanocellales archaeon]